MPVDLARLAAPGHTAVVTMELQRGVVGPDSKLPQLADEAERRGTVRATGRLCAAARAAGIPVVHATAQFRADRRGVGRNAPLLAALVRVEGHLDAGTPPAELHPDLGADGSDLVVPRSHGVSPFSGTELDATLRALGATTLVGAGVSVNIGLFGLVLEAVNLGYSVVVPEDATAGVPAAYAEAVLANSIGLLAARTTVDELCKIWAG